MLEINIWDTEPVTTQAGQVSTAAILNRGPVMGAGLTALKICCMKGVGAEFVDVADLV